MTHESSYLKSKSAVTCHEKFYPFINFFYPRNSLFAGIKYEIGKWQSLSNNWVNFTSQNPVKFSSNRPRKNKYIMKSIWGHSKITFIEEGRKGGVIEK